MGVGECSLESLKLLKLDKTALETHGQREVDAVAADQQVAERSALRCDEIRRVALLDVLREHEQR